MSPVPRVAHAAEDLVRVPQAVVDAAASERERGVDAASAVESGGHRSECGHR